MRPPATLIRAPSNLGLRPLRPGHVPGTWRAPAALAEAGLDDVIQPKLTVEISQPPYSPESQPGTRLRNGPAMRHFNLEVANEVAKAIGGGFFPWVIGGDCSILLGALAGARKHGPVSLVHIDGHSDFRHPGNYDPQATLGSVAGMDLALATGRGEPLMTTWPGIEPPLVSDRQVVQIGERECRDLDFAWPDVNDTEITRIDVFLAQSLGTAAVLRRTYETLDQVEWPFWIHLDVDVLDQQIMPAVDSPGTPGLDQEQLVSVLRSLLDDPRAVGLTLTVFDPDLDPDGRYAKLITKVVADAISPSARVR